jgi:MoaA/NifB/PqqE/SkfB family radical SAM enzyme
MRTYPDALKFSLSAAVSVLRGKRFLSCLWELTYRCNARCAICSYWKNPGKPTDELTLRDITEGLDRAFGYGTRFVNFTGGEPTLRADLEDIVAAASTRGMWTSMVTNGSRLTPARIRALKDAGLDNLLISFDSLTPGVHDDHRGFRGLHAHVVRALEWLHDDFLTGHRSGGLMCVIARHNVGSLEEIVRFAEALGVYVLLQPYHINKTGEPGLGTALDDESVRRLVGLKARCGSVLNSRSYLAALGRFYGSGPGPACQAGLKYFSVDPYGFIHPCVDMPAVGHILRDDIAVVRSDQARAAVKECQGCWYCFRGEADTSLSVRGCLEKVGLAIAVTCRNATSRRARASGLAGACESAQPATKAGE